jgi:hypothetical protein
VAARRSGAALGTTAVVVVPSPRVVATRHPLRGGCGVRDRTLRARQALPGVGRFVTIGWHGKITRIGQLGHDGTCARSREGGPHAASTPARSGRPGRSPLRPRRAGPALADTVAVNEDQYSHGSDILNARLGIERTTDSTQGRFRLRLRCFRGSAAQTCDFSFGSGDDVCWQDLTAGTSACKGLDPRSGSDVVWTGSWHTLIRGHQYRAFVDDYRAHFRASGYTGAYHDIYSLVYTH